MTRLAISERRRIEQAERTEERRLKLNAACRAWRARNVEHVRALRRASMERWYQRMLADPKLRREFRERTARARTKVGPEKRRAYLKRWREKNRDRLREYERAKRVRLNAAKKSPAAAPGTENTPASSARLVGPAALSQ